MNFFSILSLMLIGLALVPQDPIEDVLFRKKHKLGVVSSAGTPTLNQFFGNNITDKGRGGSTTGVNGNVFALDPAGSPHAVTSGSLVIMSGAWPNNPTTGNGYPHSCTAPCAPTFTDNGTGNTWNAVFTAGSGCKDAGLAVANGADHGIYYSANFVPPASGVTQVTETHPDKISDSYFNIGNFYNVATTSALRTSSCKTAVVPVNNTAPNISGTALTVVIGDLVYVEVDDETIFGNIDYSDIWNSITVPSNCTLVDESTYAGHAEFYCSATGTTFTPQLTISQSTHDSFTIMAAAFKPGSGGSAPSAGKAVLVSSATMTGGAITLVTNVGCPTNTTGVIITDDAASLSSITDSNSDTYTAVSNGGGNPKVFYSLGVTISNPNTFVVTTVSGGANVDLIRFYCTNVTALDTGFSAGSGSTQVTSSAVFNAISTGTGAGNCQGTSGSDVTCTGLPLATPGNSADLFIAIGSAGNGPYLTSSQPTGVVLDYPGPTLTNACTVTTAGVCGGDANDMTNGDVAAHYWSGNTTQINFGWTAQQNASSNSVMVVAFH